VSTTTNSPVTDVASFVAGLIVAEGCFTRTRNDFAFAVTLGSDDRGSVEALHAFLALGRLVEHRRRKPHYQDEVTFVVKALGDLVDVVVPFMDGHLPPSYKRQQYETWRNELLEYWDTKAKRRRPCTADGCEAPRRAKGLCRHHYYEAYGR
jgi:hypothetical protein